MLAMKTLVFSPKRMKKARLRMEWSQSQLARAMDTREQNVNRWEQGLNVPGANVVARLAQATRRDIEFFYVEVGAEDDEEEAALRRRARAFLEAMDDDMVAALHAEASAKVVGRVASHGSAA